MNDKYDPSSNYMTLNFTPTEADLAIGHFYHKSEYVGPRQRRNTCLCGDVQDGYGSELFNKCSEHLKQFGIYPRMIDIGKN